jgi:DNA-binding winged helix-turn-helix (wHTH) protein
MTKELRLNDWRFRPALQELTRGKIRKHLPAQQSRVLEELVSRRGEIVTRDRLIHVLWPTRVVDYQRSLNAIMKQLRHALDDDRDRPQYIETLPRKGYRLVARVQGSRPVVESYSHERHPANEELVQHAASQAQLLKRLIDTAVELVGAEFGAVFLRTTNPQGSYEARFEVSGMSRAVFERFPLPRSTDIFARSFNGEIIVTGSTKKDSRFGKNPPHYGPPKGHPVVTSYMGIPVGTHDGRVIAAFFLGHSKAERFDMQAQTGALLLARTAAEALDLSSKLHATLRRMTSSHDAVTAPSKFLVDAPNLPIGAACNPAATDEPGR